MPCGVAGLISGDRLGYGIHCGGHSACLGNVAGPRGRACVALEFYKYERTTVGGRFSHAILTFQPLPPGFQLRPQEIQNFGTAERNIPLHCFRKQFSGGI